MHLPGYPPSMLSWIPILGPIIDGLTKIAGGFFSTKQAQIEADVQTSQIIAHTTEAFHDDPGFRLLRDLAFVPAVVFIAVVGWDGLVVHHYPHLYWEVAAFPQGLEWYPYAALTALFGLNLMSIWKK